jgi:GTP-binding protein SAR1
MKWLWDWLSIGRGDWLTNLLSYLGLVAFPIFPILSLTGLSNKRGKLLFLGLDNAGKTTLTGVLKHGKITQNAPTQRPGKSQEIVLYQHTIYQPILGTEEMSLGGIKFLVYDLGGHEQGLFA